MKRLLKSNFVTAAFISLGLQFPIIAFAQDYYSSNFVNQSNQGTTKYTLVKTRSWPETGCIVDSGPNIILPGDGTKLVIANKKECSEAGIGYSLYKTADLNREHLLGYVSHRFRDGKFSLQVSIFCEGNQCIFRDLNPEQNRK
ncbi:hypothetical protein ACNVED_13575 [Legionella sp. D16C41]|uniref:hypothetical protein n=1 Tax=Legionella sp. D16C41 TaxID=3402688 RepID=UPI003AF7747E